MEGSEAKSSTETTGDTERRAGHVRGTTVDRELWQQAYEARMAQKDQMEKDAAKRAANESPNISSAAGVPAPVPEEPTDPDAMYPPRRDDPNINSAPYSSQNFEVLFGSNAPPTKKVEPLPPVGPVFFFRVLLDAQPVHELPDAESAKVGSKSKGEVVRVTDFNGAWLRLACETEAEVESKFQGWMISESVDDTLLEEIEDPGEHEKEYTKGLIRRIWKVNDHVKARVTEKSERAKQYLRVGRVPPGKKETLPEGTRCLNAYWGLEARWVPLAKGEEYWPQGCLTHTERTLRAGWEQPKEEARSGHWRVFAARPFEANELVEVCPLVKVDAIEATFACMQLRMNVVETPADDDAEYTHKEGRVQMHLPLGYGMLYQQSLELWDVQVNWTPVTNFNCKMLPHNGHMYVYSTRRIQADEELVLRFERNFRTDNGRAIDFTGFTPYWCREKPPETFAKSLVTPSGPRKVRPVPGRVKFGKSQLHERGAFADASFKRGEIVEMCPAFIVDLNGVDSMRDYVYHLPAVKVKLDDRELVKREDRYVLPLGYGGLYNHSESRKGGNENVSWYYDETTQCVIYVANPSKEDCNEIAFNEELCYDYGEAYWETTARRYQRPGFEPGERLNVLEEMASSKVVLDDIGQKRYL